jgi:hypothetical protein
MVDGNTYTWKILSDIGKNNAHSVAFGNPFISFGNPVTKEMDH